MTTTAHTTERAETRATLDKTWIEVARATTRTEQDKAWAAWDKAFVVWASATSPQAR